MDLPHELANTLNRVDTDHETLVRALEFERRKVDCLSLMVKDMHAALVHVCAHTNSPAPFPALGAFPMHLLEPSPPLFGGPGTGYSFDGAGLDAAAPGIMVTSPTDPTPPGTLHFHSLTTQQNHSNAWGAAASSPTDVINLSGGPLSTISPSSSPTTSSFPQSGPERTNRRMMSTGSLGGMARQQPLGRMNIPVLPRFDSSPSLNSPVGGAASRTSFSAPKPPRKLSLPPGQQQQQQGMIYEDPGADVGGGANGYEVTMEGEDLQMPGAKRQRMNPGFGVNVARANSSMSMGGMMMDGLSSPSPGGGTFSGPPSSTSSTTPSGSSFNTGDLSYGGAGGPKHVGMSITIPSNPLHQHSPRSTSRLVNSALAGQAMPPHPGHVRTLARARSDSAPHGVSLGGVWRVNGTDALGYTYVQQQQQPQPTQQQLQQQQKALGAAGRPRSGTHHPYAPSPGHHSRGSFSGTLGGGVSRSPSLASIGSAMEPNASQAQSSALSPQHHLTEETGDGTLGTTAS